jgi:hypothetical protein
MSIYAGIPFSPRAVALSRLDRVQGMPVLSRIPTGIAAEDPGRETDRQAVTCALPLPFPPVERCYFPISLLIPLYPCSYRLTRASLLRYTVKTRRMVVNPHKKELHVQKPCMMLC